MTIFVYSAAKRDGVVVNGEREAENEKELAKNLRKEELYLLEARPKGGRVGVGSIDIGEIFYRFKGVSVVEKMFFSRNLGVMIAAGLSLTKALEALAEQTTNLKFKKIITEVNASVAQGKSFSDSLRPHQKVFSELYVNMIEVGESTGKLTLVLKLLANQMKKDHTLKSRVRGAMMYPGIILTTLAGVGALMMVYVVPTLTTTIKELGVELPITTRAIIFVSDFMVAYFVWAIVGTVLAVFGFVRLLKTTRGKEIFDFVVLRFPLFGPLIKKFNMARFSRTLSYLISSGVPIVRSLEITASILGNTYYRRATLEASVEIQKGRQLNEILAPHKEIFEPILIQMMKVGEETGKNSSMLLRLALFFEEEVNNTTKNLSTIIEPILMVVIGAIVGLFAVSMLQPIYSSLGNI